MTHRNLLAIALAVLAVAMGFGCSQATPADSVAVATTDADAGKASFGDAAKPVDIKSDADAAKASDAAPEVDGPPNETAIGGDDAEVAIGPDAAPDQAGEVTGEESEVVGADAKACTTDGACDDKNACTTDTCTAQGCAYVTKNCDDGLGCTADACDKNTGNCKHKALAETCAIEGACYATGEASATNACKVCDPGKSATTWSDADSGGCDDGNACTGKDQCAGGVCVGVAKPGCCKADTDCAVSDACATATCDVATGSCQVTAKPKCCTDGLCCDPSTNAIKPAGGSCGGAVIATQWQCSGQDVQSRTGTAGCTGTDAGACSEDLANLLWSAWKTQQSCGTNAKCVANGTTSATCEVTAPVGCKGTTECDDKNLCTDDSCGADGKCSNLPKKCSGATACQVPACDATTGNCSYSVQAGNCEIGSVCMLAGAKNAADSCQTCQPDVSQKLWSTAATCKCTSGACCASGVVKPAGTVCGTTPIATEYGCSADGKTIQTRVAFAGCSGPGATCATTTTNAVWQPWTDKTACAADQVCEVLDKTVNGTCKTSVDPLCSQADPYEDGAAIASAHDLGTFTDGSAKKTMAPNVIMGSASDVDVLKWTINDAASTAVPQASVTWSSAQTVKVCVYAACSTGAGGSECQAITCPIGTVSVTNLAVSPAPKNGCCATGTKGSLSFLPKSTIGTNNSAVVYLEVSNASPACTQLAAEIAFGAPATPACTAGSVCCAADGTFAAKNTACGVITMATEYKCESSLPGGKILSRKAVTGCPGTAASCSAASADYSWSDWTASKTCLSGEVCSVTAPTTPGTCVAASACVPNSQCCTADGKFAASTVQCGAATATEYQCSGTAIQVRKQFSTCAGASTGCYGTSTWSPWVTAANCAATQTCTAGSIKSTLPTCKPGAPDLCKITDDWEGPEFTADSKDLGVFSDASTAMYIDPKVLLQSATDKDYFKYAITDDTNFYDPEVYVNWSATAPVTVCAYYRCNAGAGGQDCAPVTCPFGSDPYNNSVVSQGKPNGCCMTATAGTLDYFPDAPGMDETGTVFINVKSTTATCQEVTVKIGFGASTTTKCSPGNTCCSNKGTYAASTVTCGSASKVQYKCATVNGVSEIDKQTALGQCSGTSTSCNTTVTTWGAWALDKPCIGPEVCAVGVPASGGACVAPKMAGSCVGFCGA